MSHAPQKRANVRVLFLTRYGSDGASSRYRTLQFVPWLAAHGVDCTVQSLFEQGYVTKRFGGMQKYLALLPTAYWRRVRKMLAYNHYDLLSIEKELFPFMPGAIESDLFLRNARYTVDYDDAMYHRYDQHPSALIRMVLKRKISKIMAGAGAVTAGSHYILDYARKFNKSAFLIPTVVDLANYPDTEPPLSSTDPFVVGWIGSQATLQYLENIEGVLNEFCSGRKARILVIGGKPVPSNISSIQWIPWTRDNEVKWLSTIHVGIMPLPRNPWSMGKCAFKLIQYMACWKPVVASPVGENNYVVTNGVNGFLADTDMEWIEALDCLYRDRKMCREMGRAGRRLIETHYNLNSVAPAIMNILSSVAHGNAGT